MRAEAGTQTMEAKAILAAAGAAREETIELLLAKLPTLAAAGEPTPLNQLLELAGKRLSCALITILLWQGLFFLNNLMVITRANGQYQG